MASRTVGYQPLTCEKRVQLGVHVEVGEYVRAARLSGNPDIAVKLASPTLQALDAGDILSLNDALRREEKADAEEQIAQLRWILEKSPENRVALVRAWRLQVATTLDAIRALEAEPAHA